MEKTQINFKQERDFGEIFNATFTFIGQEFKKLGTAFLYFVLPVFLVIALIAVFIQIKTQSIGQSITGGNIGDISSPFDIFTGPYILALVLLVLLFAIGFTVLQCTIYGYIKLYAEKGRDNFEISDVWNQITKFFMPFVGTSIVVFFVVFFGTIFCILPGIYLSVSLSVIFMALFFEDKGFSNAFSRSFDLTKQRWWLTFGLIIISSIIVQAISLILSIPSLILGLKPLLTGMKDMTEMTGFQFPTAYYIVNTIVSLITYVLYIIPATVIAFQYFSLVEMKDKPSLDEKINQIETNE